MSGSQANPSTTSGAANGTNASATGGSNSQAGIRGVIDLESQATMLLDRHGVITYLDRNIAKVFDYAAQDLIGQKFVRLLAAPFDTHYAQLLANVAASSNKHHALLNFSTPSSRLVEARTKRGECFAVALYLSIVVERDVVVFVVAVERAKQPVGVLTACKGIVLSCNAECERIFGYGPGEMLGQRVASLVAATANLPSLRVARGADNGDDDELTLYVDFLQPSQPRKRTVSDISSVNLVAGTPVSSSGASSAAATPADWMGENDADGDILDNLDHFDSDDDDDAAAVSDDDDDAAASFVSGRTDALTKKSSTAVAQTFRAVEVETDCVDKIGRHFSARVLLQRKRMGVVELFRGFIQPVVGGDMAVLMITDSDGHILAVSQMYCKAMLGYSTLEIVQMNINEVLTGLPVTGAPPPRTTPAAAAAAAAAANANANANAGGSNPSSPTTPIIDDVSESVSVAAPGIRIPRNGATAAAANNNNGANGASSGVTSLSASGESSTLESVLRESASGESNLSNSFIGATSDEDNDTDEDDDDDLSEDMTSPRVASPQKRELVTSNVKRARAEHGSAVFVRHNTDVSPNFAYSVGRRTTARHKSGAQIVLLMDVMRFLTHDGQVRFSVRLYTPMTVDEGTMTPPPQQEAASGNPSRRTSSSSIRRRASAMASASVSEATSPPPASPTSAAAAAAAAGAAASPPTPVVRQVPFLGDYMLSRELGRGSFATVRLGTHVQTGEQRAIKLFLLDHGTPDECAEVRRRALREVSVLERVRGHPHVVNLYEVIDGDAAGGGTALVLEYVSGGELFNAIVSRGGLAESEARLLFRQLANAVHHCHVNGVAHRDLKHQNILTDGHGRVLLIDFGLAISVVEACDPADLQMGVGTPAYAAPEMLRGTVLNPLPSDIWSLGVVLYSMVMADFPFRNVTDVLNGQFDSSRAERLSASLTDLLSQMLVKEPSQRVTIDIVLQHAWLTGEQ